MALPEDGEKFQVGDPGRIELDLHSFGVPCASAANVLISGIPRRAASVSGGDRSDAFHLAKCILNTPETSCRKCSLGHGFSSLHLILTKCKAICCHIARLRSSRQAGRGEYYSTPPHIRCGLHGDRCEDVRQNYAAVPVVCYVSRSANTTLWFFTAPLGRDCSRILFRKPGISKTA